MKGMIRCFVQLCIGLLVIGGCHAESVNTAWAGDNLTIRGFGTLGLARSNVNAVEYVRDLSQPHGLTRKWSADIDSMLGVQANLKLDTQTEGVVQVISRYRYDGSYRPEVSWAFLRHEFSPDFQMRVGRLGTEFYMNADSRLIGYSNLMVRPQPDFYGPLVFSYYDGIDAAYTRKLGPGLVRAKLYGGYSPEKTAFSDPLTWDLKGTRLVGGYLDYFQGPWQFRVSHAQARFANESPMNAMVGLMSSGFLNDVLTHVPELRVQGTTVAFDSLGAVYDDGPLQIQAMLGRIRYDTTAYENSRAAFITAGYRLGAFTPYLGYSTSKSTSRPLLTSLPPFINAIASGINPATHSDQHTFTVGTRWDFHPNMALKLQLDTVRGSPDSVFLYRGGNIQSNGRMDVLSVSMDFAF
jgi:hypothetical protein